jgi:predicted ATPase/DNA-binding XRE family transcriptional regulator
MEPRTGASFPGLLRGYRLTAGLTQEILAERAGVSVRSLQALESGAHRPLKDTVQRLIAALGLQGEERAYFLAAGGPLPRWLAGVHAAAPALSTLAVTVGTPSSALPRYLTSFVGRDQELAVVTDLLARTRLLTLTGAGGVGKTRLALRVAAVARDDFTDGVVFAPLAAIGDPGILAPTLADVLCVRQGEQPSVTAAIIASLRLRRLLLVLDNFEQIIAAGLLLAELLAACPGLKMLVTSRMALHLSGEQEYAVLPLPVSAAGERATIERVRLGQAPAMTLFEHRAQLVRPDFVLGEDNLATVTEICRRLDGLPLAIELAAARVKLLSPAALLARLGQRLQVLTGGPHDLPARQQTLRNTIAWSHALLSSSEQALFARLGVFAGGCTLEAAEAVCGHDLAVDDTVLDDLAALVDKSLLRQVETESEPRFVLLETIGEFARDVLAARGEAEDVAYRHTQYFASLAEEAHRGLQSPEVAIWMARLDVEAGNLRAALRFCVEQGRLGNQDATELGLHLAGTLWFSYWVMHGQMREGCVWLRQLLALPNAAVRTAGRAVALAGLAHLTRMTEASDSSVVLAEEGLAIARETCSAAQISWILVALGLAAFDQDRTRAAMEEALTRGRGAGDHGVEAWALIYLGCHGLRTADLAGAQRYFAQGRALAVAHGNHWPHAWALTGLALVARAGGDLDQAGRLLEEELALHEELAAGRPFGHTRWLLGHTQWLLAEVTEEQGNAAAARGYYAAAQVALHDTWDGGRLSRVLAGSPRPR